MNVGRFHTDQVRSTIFNLWGQNCSLREIARQLGMSRNMVGGLIKRMNLPSRDPVPRSQKPRGWVANRINKAKPKAPEPLGPLADFPPAGHCVFIAGEPRGQFQCCGHVGYPYCEYHAARCYYQPKKVAA